MNDLRLFYEGNFRIFELFPQGKCLRKSCCTQSVAKRKVPYPALMEYFIMLRFSNLNIFIDKKAACNYNYFQYLSMAIYF